MTDHHSHDVDVDTNTARVRALQSLLIEKGLVTTDAIDEVLRAHDEEIGPMNGKQVVARAWKDPAFENQLLTDAPAALADLGFEITQGHIDAVKNTPSVHNVVVCTLCSCYPWSLLGLPPTWYKSHEYRSRVVREPNQVLAEFGLDIDDDRDIRVWDSTSELRYFVIPQPPAGYENLSQEELTEYIPKNSMIGVDTATPIEE